MYNVEPERLLKCPNKPIGPDLHLMVRPSPFRLIFAHSTPRPSSVMGRVVGDETDRVTQDSCFPKLGKVRT